MARICNGVAGALNLLTLLASLAAIGAALCLRLRGGATDCERVLLPLALALAAAMLVASALGLFGACFRRRAYLALLFVVIVAAVSFTVAVLVVTHRGAVGRKLCYSCKTGVIKGGWRKLAVPVSNDEPRVDPHLI